MFRRFVKVLLVGTALAPALLIMAIDFYSTDVMPSCLCFGNQLVVIALALVLIAVCVMKYAVSHGQRQPLIVVKAKNSDKEVLTFLLAYLLPVISEHKLLFKSFNVPTVAVMALVCAVIYHSNAFDFNPLLGMLGYHFYEVEDDDKFPYLLISSHSIRKPCDSLTVIQLFDYTFLAVPK